MVALNRYMLDDVFFAAEEMRTLVILTVVSWLSDAEHFSDGFSFGRMGFDMFHDSLVVQQLFDAFL